MRALAASALGTYIQMLSPHSYWWYTGFSLLGTYDPRVLVLYVLRRSQIDLNYLTGYARSWCSVPTVVLP